MSQNLDETMTVSLAISLDTIVRETREYDEDGDYVGGGGVTLAQAVAEHLADRLTKDARQNVDFNSIRREINTAVGELVSEKLADFTEREIIPTDTYGMQRGEPRTITQEIIDVASKWCNATSRDSFGTRGETNLQKLIKDEVSRAFTAELKKIIDAAKAEVTAKVREHAAAVLAESFTAAVKL